MNTGEQFGTVPAVEMMQHPVFRGWFKAAQAQLRGTDLAH
jgi:hypothetical protein